MRDPIAHDLANKAVLVTGASTGIGAAAARAFAELKGGVVPLSTVIRRLEALDAAPT